MAGSKQGNFNSQIIKYASYAALKEAYDTGQLGDGVYIINNLLYTKIGNTLYENNPAFADTAAFNAAGGASKFPNQILTVGGQIGFCDGTNWTASGGASTAITGQSIAALSATNTAAQNTAAIIAAWNALPSAGGAIILPAGKFNCNPWTAPDSKPVVIRGQGIGAYRNTGGFDDYQGSQTEIYSQSLNTPWVTNDKGAGFGMADFAIRSDPALGTPVSGSTAYLLGNGSSGTASRGGCNAAFSRMAFVGFFCGATQKGGVYAQTTGCHFIGNLKYYQWFEDTLSVDESDGNFYGNFLYFLNNYSGASVGPTAIKIINGGGLRIRNNKFNVFLGITGLADGNYSWDSFVDIEWKSYSTNGYSGQFFIENNSFDAFANDAIRIYSTDVNAGGITSMEIKNNHFACYATSNRTQRALYVVNKGNGNPVIQGNTVTNSTIDAGGITFSGNTLLGCQAIVAHDVAGLDIGINKMLLSSNYNTAVKPFYDLNRTTLANYTEPSIVTTGAEDFGNANGPSTAVITHFFNGYPRQWSQLRPFSSAWGSGGNNITNASTKTMFTIYCSNQDSAKLDLSIQFSDGGSVTQGILVLSRLIGGGYAAAGSNALNDASIKQLGTDTGFNPLLSGALGSGVTGALTIAAGTGSLSNGTTKGLAHTGVASATLDNSITATAASGAGLAISFKSQIVSSPSAVITTNSVCFAITVEITGLNATGLMVTSQITVSANLGGFAVWPS
jgi:hypothetical protein